MPSTSSSTAPQPRDTGPAIWLQDLVQGKIRRKRFIGFEGELRCDAAQTFAATTARIEELRKDGKHLAGFISYEAGYLTETSLASLMPEHRDVPLIWMGIFSGITEDFLEAAPANIPRAGPIEALTPELGTQAYEEAIEKTLAYIKAGDIYQANFTYRSAFTWSGEPAHLFDALTRTQPVPYAAYINTGKEIVLSLSPELFFDISGNTIRARPMKGTSRRGRTNFEDDALAAALAADPKERAENLMILDLMRNDLSRIARPGSVRVPERFNVERYRTVLQMTSSVEADLKSGVDFPAILDALFPCGSVTGAPKVRAMEIISQLEQSPRGVYTGAIGHLGPNTDGQGEAVFNVAIRTLTLKQKPGVPDTWTGSVGVGGGIVYDSTPAREYEECQVKIGFLGNPDKEPVQLIETMKAEAGKIDLLREHMNRLEDSARYFDFPCTIKEVAKTLIKQAGALPAGPWRLRLLLGADGNIEISRAPLAHRLEPLRFTLAEPRVTSSDVFLHHKTTRRALFEDTLAEQSARCGADEVLFLNERSELTEGARSTLFLRKDGLLLTPPLTSGCLPGTLRASLFKDSETSIVERVLYPGDLATADEIYLGNSVRGLERAEQIT